MNAQMASLRPAFSFPAVVAFLRHARLCTHHPYPSLHWVERGPTDRGRALQNSEAGTLRLVQIVSLLCLFLRPSFPCSASLLLRPSVILSPLHWVERGPTDRGRTLQKSKAVDGKYNRRISGPTMSTDAARSFGKERTRFSPSTQLNGAALS